MPAVNKEKKANYYALACYTICSLVALTLMLMCSSQLWNQSLMSASTPAKEVKFTIKTTSAGPRKFGTRFICIGQFTYKVDGTTYTNTTEFTHQKFLTEKEALKTASLYETQEWKVWYNPKNPQTSTLPNDLPLRELIAGLLIWVLGIMVLYQTRLFIIRDFYPALKHSS